MRRSQKHSLLESEVHVKGKGKSKVAESFAEGHLKRNFEKGQEQKTAHVPQYDTKVAYFLEAHSTLHVIQKGDRN